ncbi:hypothetical protein Poly30_02350 [Planctomycetes bacterium Poly30]|uniref:Uncharacterized protein n=1 Tax=Saltatorellus ferox TaxID=2528018 RepID=A0A518EKY4_9BACT|nr:hypothetical protein Poly30_02350 [Planctomycetes bacterium Poly30]
MLPPLPLSSVFTLLLSALLGATSAFPEELETAHVSSGVAGTFAGQATSPSDLPVECLDPRSMLHFTPHDDGMWVRGRSYKARIAESGFTYVPYLGPSAPRNFPVEFRLNAATLAEEPLFLNDVAVVHRAGSRFVLDRGPVDVIYDMALDSVEQSFAVEAAGATGDLVLTLEVTSELRGVQNQLGLRFGGEFGGITYGSAVVLDGVGRRADVPMHWSGSELTLIVPASFLRTAEGPIVVDPIIYTFTVDNSSGDQDYPDISYDSTTDRFTVVYEDMFSGTDTDIYRTTITSTGGFASAGYIESGTDEWTAPSVANLNATNTTLVVAQRINPFTGLSEIVGRTLNEVTGALGAVLVIGDALASYQNYRPDVGGNSSTSGISVFLVAWERRFSATQSAPRYRTVAADGTLGSIVFLDGGVNMLAEEVRVSKSTGDPSNVNLWNVAYRRENLATDRDEIVTVQVMASGAVLNGPSVAYLGAVGQRLCEIDVSDGIRCMGQVPSFAVTFDDYSLGYNDATILLCRGTGLLREFNLTTTEHANIIPDQARVQLSTTPNSFLATYFEAVPTNFGYHVYETSFTQVEGNTVGISERRSLVGITLGAYRGAPAIASRASGGLDSRISAVVWARRDLANLDYEIDGAIHFDSNGPAVGAQYCYGNPNSSGDRGFIALYGSGTPTGQMTAIASALPPNVFGYFLTSRSTGYVANPGGSAGVLCLGGSIGRYSNSVMSSGSFGEISMVLNPTMLPTPTGPAAAVSGQSWSFQLWHRDSAGSTATSNFTNAVSIQFL